MLDNRGLGVNDLLIEFTTLSERDRIAWLGKRIYSSCQECYGLRLGLATWTLTWRSFFEELDRLCWLQAPERQLMNALYEWVEWQLTKDLSPEGA